MSMDLFNKALAAEGVTGQLAEVARSIYAQESSLGSNAQTSNRGARGGMQILPKTFKGVADKDWSIDDPFHNARAGIRYVKEMAKLANGDPFLTAAGYYGGPNGLARAQTGQAVSDPKNPKAPNTLQYAAQVVSRLGKTQPNVMQGFANVAAKPRQVEEQPIQVAWDPRDEMPFGDAPVADLQPSPSDDAVPAVAKAQGQTTDIATADTWQEFLKNMPRPVEGAGMAYGPAEVAMPQLNVPNFQNVMAGFAPVARPNFQSFTGFRGRA